MAEQITVDDFGAALSEFVAISAHRIATTPHDEVGRDEMAAFNRVKSTLAALLGRAKENDNG